MTSNEDAASPPDDNPDGSDHKATPPARKPWELNPEDYDPERADTPIHTRGPMEGQPIDPQRPLPPGLTPLGVLAEHRYQQKIIHWTGREPQPLPIWDLDGVSWTDAPAPPLFHRHWAQTVGIDPKSGAERWRCPCGALGGLLEPWIVLDKRRVAPGWLRRALTTLVRGKPRHNETEQEKP